VTSARNGEQALEMVRRNVPDLVLLDMMMSYVLDGLDVRRAMTEDPLLKAVPVIMMTSATVAGGGTARLLRAKISPSRCGCPSLLSQTSSWSA